MRSKQNPASRTLRCEVILPPRFLSRPAPLRTPSPRAAGRGEQALSFSRCDPHPSHRHAVRISSLSAPIFARECRRWIPVSSRSALRATNVRKESKEAERRQTRSQRPHPAGCGARGAPRARLSASHHGSCQRDVGPQGSASGQASWDVVSPGVTRCLLSQSSGSTPRTGRNAGEHDARTRPGTAVTNHRPREPSLAPLARVIDQRPCTRARLRLLFQI